MGAPRDERSVRRYTSAATRPIPWGLLPVRSQHQEIPILWEYDATEVRRSLQEELVVTIGRAVRFRGQHVDALLPYADRNRSWHVVIEVQPEAHCRPARFSFSRSTEGCCAPAMRSTSASCWAITASRASR